MKTILVPTDFSESSLHAIRYSADLARALHAKLILFHSYMIPAPVGIEEIPYVPMPMEDIRKEQEGELHRLAEKINGESANGKESGSGTFLEVETMARIGIPSDEIRAAAEERGADLIVMAARSEKVRKTRIPVLLIPDQSGFSPFGRVAYATDFSYGRQNDLFAPLVTLLRAFGASLDILHVEEENHEAGSGDSLARQAGLDGKRELESVFREFGPCFSTVKGPSVIRAIHSFTAENKAGLLVMVAHKHGMLDRLFHKSSTWEMAHETSIPLLVLQG